MKRRADQRQGKIHRSSQSLMACLLLKRRSLTLLCPLSCLAFAGCDRQPISTAAAQEHVHPVHVHQEQLQRASAAPAQIDSACAPMAALAAMDPRRPVPLQPMMAWHQKQNMMAHLIAIQRIVDALSRRDWEKVIAASTALEPSPQMQQMCQHMGAGAAGFTERALDFHQRATRISAAARAEDQPGVLRATAETLAACTSCHSAYRQEIVDAETWAERAGAAHHRSMTVGESSSPH